MSQPGACYLALRCLASPKTLSYRDLGVGGIKGVAHSRLPHIVALSLSLVTKLRRAQGHVACPSGRYSSNYLKPCGGPYGNPSGILR